MFGYELLLNSSYVIGLAFFLGTILLTWLLFSPLRGRNLMRTRRDVGGDYNRYIGFFHPFWYNSIEPWLCLRSLNPDSNAAGGGERVLWAAIKATQERYPQAACIVYTGDIDVPDSGNSISKKAKHANSKDAICAIKRDVILEKVEVRKLL